MLILLGIDMMLYRHVQQCENCTLRKGSKSCDVSSHPHCQHHQSHKAAALLPTEPARKVDAQCKQNTPSPSKKPGNCISHLVSDIQLPVEQSSGSTQCEGCSDTHHLHEEESEEGKAQNFNEGSSLIVWSFLPWVCLIVPWGLLSLSFLPLIVHVLP